MEGPLLCKKKETAQLQWALHEIHQQNGQSPRHPPEPYSCFFFSEGSLVGSGIKIMPIMSTFLRPKKFSCSTKRSHTIDWLVQQRYKLGVAHVSNVNKYDNKEKRKECLHLVMCYITLSILNPLAPGNFEFHSINVIFNLGLLIDIFRSSNDNVLRWFTQNLTEDQSTLVQVMAWCHQATSHYLSQSWLQFFITICHS